MRTLIRDLDTDTFFRTENEWTTEPLRAFDFQDGERATTAARNLSRKNLEVHVVSDDGKSVFGTAIQSGS